jgi:hypothetical protein
MLDAFEAHSILNLCHISRGDDFHRLNSDRVETLLYYADLHKYRQPKNANGSRARYFHAYLQRRANSDD